MATSSLRLAHNTLEADFRADQASYWHEGRRHVGPDTFRTKSDGWAYLSGIETSIRRGGWVDPLAGDVTLRVYVSDWLADRPNLRPRTVDKYRYLLEHNILPLLGDKTMTDLSPAAVRSWHARLSALRPTTAAAAYRLLSSICRTAIADELIARSPCQVRGGGSEHSPERPLVSIAEVEALADAMPERLRALVLLASWCGLRRGEVLGLQRRDVDVARGTVHIERAVVHMLDGTTTIGPPKSEAGTRTVHYPSNTAPAIENHLRGHVGYDPTAWLFAGTTGNPLAVKTLQRARNSARASIGRPDVRLHDLRHAGATWAAVSGATTKELMSRLGHATPVAALRYQHATAERDKALAVALAELAASAKVIPIDEHRRRRTDRAVNTESTESIAHESRTPLRSTSEGQPGNGPSPGDSLERTTGFEPATLTLAKNAQ